MKLLHLFTEEKADDNIGHDYKTKVKSEMLGISKAIATVLKTVSYRVAINISSQQDFMHRRYGVSGMVAVLNTYAPGDQDSNFYAKMIGKLVERELKKRFSRSAILEVHVSPYTGTSGQKVDSVYVTFMVPDADGSFSVNTQP